MSPPELSDFGLRSRDDLDPAWLCHHGMSKGTRSDSDSYGIVYSHEHNLPGFGGLGRSADHAPKPDLGTLRSGFILAEDETGARTDFRAGNSGLERFHLIAVSYTRMEPRIWYRRQQEDCYHQKDQTGACGEGRHGRPGRIPDLYIGCQARPKIQIGFPPTFVSSVPKLQYTLLCRPRHLYASSTLIL
jgi:hypothetical protein